MNLSLALSMIRQYLRRNFTPSAPVINSVSIVGTGEVGQPLGVQIKRSGWPTPTITYVWKSEGVAISGETGKTYTPVEGDIGDEITCTVTATNTEGSDTETTAGVTVIEATQVVATFDSGSISFDSNQQTFDEAA